MNTQTQWPDLAERLVLRDWPESISSVYTQAKMLGVDAGNTRLGLAVSGGADSVCLALLAWSAFSKQRERTIILHFNHRRRGVDSDGDAAFVAGMAAGLGFQYQQGQSHLSSESPVNEAILREERLNFFKSSGCGVILQGHQRDDILETQLMRLCRGSGVEGLAAPRRVSRLGKLLFMRPLLDLGRDEIRGALRDCDIPWREDASNAGGDFLRNRIRHDVVPALREATSREPSEGAALSRQLLEEDALALDALVQELYPNGFAGTLLTMPPFRKLPPAILRRAFYAWLGHHGIAPERAQMEALLAAAQNDDPVTLTLAGGRQVEVSRVQACLLTEDTPVEEWEALECPIGAELTLTSGTILAAERIPLTDELRAHILSGQVDPERGCYLAVNADAPGFLTVRPWQAGDRYQALGAPGSRKLSDMFIDAKIPQKERKARPLVCWEDNIVWIPGFPPADAYRIESGTEWALRLTYRPFSKTI